MWLSHFAEFVLTLALLLINLEVRSQNTQFQDGDQLYRPSASSARVCDSNKLCIPLQECRPFRSQPDRRNAGKTCGPGLGEFRQVCCPYLNGGRIGVPRTMKSSSRTTETPMKPTRLVRCKLAFKAFNFNQGECGQSRTENKYIMGGQNATEGAWPWMAAIRIRKKGGIYTPWCSGFLINRRHVISAAHCYHNINARQYIARIGRVNQEEADTYKISSITVSQRYARGKFYSDIAVLVLTKDVDFPGFNPVCMPDETLLNQNQLTYGTAVAGWGFDRPGGNMSIVLREIRRMPIVPNNKCNSILRRRIGSFRSTFPEGINEELMCAGFVKGERDACWGDSGGPLMRQDRNKWFVVGIVSFGYSCGLPGTPAGYTRISQHLNWIWENTRD